MKNAVIVIPFHLFWSWSADFMKQTAQYLSAENHVFCYLGVEPIHFKQLFRHGLSQFVLKNISKNLWIFRPVYVIPFERFTTVRTLNEKISLTIFQFLIFLKLRKSAISKRVLWIFNCRFHFLLNSFFKDYTVLYDCVDYVWDPDAKICAELQNQENDLIARSSVMSVNSHALYQVHKGKRKDIYLVPQGFRMNEFTGPLKKAKEVRQFHTPVIGMVGVINYRIHYQLLYTLAKRNPKWTFVLWGHRDNILHNNTLKVKENMHRLTSLSNIVFGESRTSQETYSMIKRFDICMIPYNISYGSNRYCHPMKLFEFFYAGKPVIATQILELQRFSKYVRIGKTVKEWERHIQNLLSHPWFPSLQKEQKGLAAENSWERKMNSINQIIASASTGTFQPRHTNQSA